MTQSGPADQGDPAPPFDDDDTQPVPVVVPPAAGDAPQAVAPESAPLPGVTAPAPETALTVEPAAALAPHPPDRGAVAAVPAGDQSTALPPSPPPPGLPPVVPAAQLPPASVEIKEGPGLLVRAVWFVFVGWWLSAIVSTVAWIALVTIVGIPLGIWLINRIPTVITLRPRTRELQQVIDASGVARLTAVPVAQQPWWLRGVWFLLVGWWASAIVMFVGWVLIVLILTLPIGLWMFNRVPFVASLYRY